MCAKPCCSPYLLESGGIAKRDTLLNLNRENHRMPFIPVACVLISKNNSGNIWWLIKVVYLCWKLTNSMGNTTAYQVSVRVNGWFNKTFSKTLYPTLESAQLAMIELHNVDPYEDKKINNKEPYVSLCKVENDCCYTTIGFYQ